MSSAADQRRPQDELRRQPRRERPRAPARLAEPQLEPHGDQRQREQCRCKPSASPPSAASGRPTGTSSVAERRAPGMTGRHATRPATSPSTERRGSGVHGPPAGERSAGTATPERLGAGRSRAGPTGTPNPGRPGRRRPDHRQPDRRRSRRARRRHQPAGASRAAAPAAPTSRRGTPRRNRDSTRASARPRQVPIKGERPCRWRRPARRRDVDDKAVERLRRFFRRPFKARSRDAQDEAGKRQGQRLSHGPPPSAPVRQGTQRDGNAVSHWTAAAASCSAAAARAAHSSGARRGQPSLAGGTAPAAKATRPGPDASRHEAPPSAPNADRALVGGPQRRFPPSPCPAPPRGRRRRPATAVARRRGQARHGAAPRTWRAVLSFGADPRARRGARVPAPQRPRATEQRRGGRARHLARPVSAPTARRSVVPGAQPGAPSDGAGPDAAEPCYTRQHASDFHAACSSAQQRPHPRHGAQQQQRSQQRRFRPARRARRRSSGAVIGHPPLRTHRQCRARPSDSPAGTGADSVPDRSRRCAPATAPSPLLPVDGHGRRWCEERVMAGDLRRSMRTRPPPRIGTTTTGIAPAKTAKPMFTAASTTARRSRM